MVLLEREISRHESDNGRHDDNDSRWFFDHLNSEMAISDCQQRRTSPIKQYLSISLKRNVLQDIAKPAPMGTIEP
jgi:hypothetical protein